MHMGIWIKDPTPGLQPQEQIGRNNETDEETRAHVVLIIYCLFIV